MILLTALAAALMLLPSVTAQTPDAPAFRLAFVDTQELIRAHPAASEIARLSEELDRELEELLNQRDQLAAQRQAGTLTPEQEELLQALQVTIQSRRDAGLGQIRSAAAPAEQAANDIIRALAEEGGYGVILDIEASSGLVVFKADWVPDLTEAALERMRELHPSD